VAGIVAALKADDAVGMACQQVNDLAFSLITPLGSHHHDTGHCQLLIRLNGYKIVCIAAYVNGRSI
jgi:hypothetical protein